MLVLLICLFQFFNNSFKWEKQASKHSISILRRNKTLKQTSRASTSTPVSSNIITIMEFDTNRQKSQVLLNLELCSSACTCLIDNWMLDMKNCCWFCLLKTSEFWLLMMFFKSSLMLSFLFLFVKNWCWEFLKEPVIFLL